MQTTNSAKLILGHIALSVLLTMQATHCSVSEDIGATCGSPNVVLPSSQASSDNPLYEIVVYNRDTQCQSTICLTSDGLSQSYCSRSCEINAKAADAESCIDDSDCLSPLQCHNNFCTTDNCPAGFWCKAAQTVGSIAGEMVCMRRHNCNNNLDCGNIGNITCQTLGCYGSCDLSGTTCLDNVEICRPIDQLNCACNNNAVTCTDHQLSCLNLPLGSVTRSRICL